jgi:hypothetical protein
VPLLLLFPFCVPPAFTTCTFQYSNRPEEAPKAGFLIPLFKSLFTGFRDYLQQLHIYLTLTIAKMAAPESEEAKTMENQGQDRAALNTALLDTSDALTPDPGTEDMFKTDQIKFAFSPGQLSKLLNPKSLNAFYALGGLNGIKRGLRTD